MMVDTLKWLVQDTAILRSFMNRYEEVGLSETAVLINKMKCVFSAILVTRFHAVDWWTRQGGKLKPTRRERRKRVF